MWSTSMGVLRGCMSNGWPDCPHTAQNRAQRATMEMAVHDGNGEHHVSSKFDHKTYHDFGGHECSPEHSLGNIHPSHLLVGQEACSPPYTFSQGDGERWSNSVNQFYSQLAESG